MRNLFVRVCEREGRRDHGAQLHFPRLHQYPAHQHRAKVTVLTLSLFFLPFPFFPIILSCLSFFFFLPSLPTNFLPREDFVGEKRSIFFFYPAFARSIYSNYFFYSLLPFWQIYLPFHSFHSISAANTTAGSTRKKLGRV